MFVLCALGGTALAVGAGLGYLAYRIGELSEVLACIMYGTGPDGKPLPRNPEHFGGAE